MRVPADVQAYRARANHYVNARGPWLEHLVEDEGLTFEQALEALTGWEFLPYIDVRHGHIATLIKRNKEVHFAFYRKFRGRGLVNRKRLAEFLQPILDKEVFLVTKIAPGEDARFIAHLGFEELGVTITGITTYILNEIRYPGIARCK